MMMHGLVNFKYVRTPYRTCGGVCPQSLYKISRRCISALLNDDLASFTSSATCLHYYVESKLIACFWNDTPCGNVFEDGLKPLG